MEEVDAFNPTTGQFLGVFADDTGTPISNDGLHGLLFGVGNSLYFTAGPAGGTQGLFGSLTPNPDTVTIEPATLAATITNVTAFVDQPFDGVVATFTDANIYALPTDFTAKVEWGDGSSDTSGDGNVTIVHSDGIGSSFIVQGTHDYTTSTTGYPPDILTITITNNSLGQLGVPCRRGTAVPVSDPTLQLGFDQRESRQSSAMAYIGVSRDVYRATHRIRILPTIRRRSTEVATIRQPPERSRLANQAATSAFIVTDGGTNGVLHKYAAATTGSEPYVITVSVKKTATDSQGKPLDESGQAVGNVAVTLPTLHVTMTAIPAVAGTTYSGQVATFTDDDSVAALENNPTGNPNLYYTAKITWGDNTFSFGTIFLSRPPAAAAVYVTGQPIYTAPSTGSSPYIASVLITKISSNESSSAVENVTVTDSLMFPVPQGVALTATEDPSVFERAVGSFYRQQSDLLTPANFNGPFASQTIISWGDGKTSVGAISFAGGLFVVSGSHVYATPTLAGIPDTVSIAVTDQWGGKTTITNSMTIGAAALTFTNLSLPTNPATPIVAGKAFTSDVSLFTSANVNATAGEYTACRSTWGDGTPIDVGDVRLDATPGVFHVFRGHTYLAAGVFTINISIMVTGGTIFLDPITATVSDAPIQYTPPGAAVTKDVTGATIAPGMEFTVSLGTMTDSDPNSDPDDFTPTIYAGGVLSQGILINWGDGDSTDDTGSITPTATPGQSYAITGTHTYDTANNYKVTVTIADADGSTSMNSLAITVAPPASTPAAPKVLAVVAQPLGQGSFLVAGQSFTDQVATFTTTTTTATASNFAASIDWGDGDDSPGTIIQGANLANNSEIFYVLGTHIYDTANTYDFSVDVSTPGNAPVSDGSTATVSGAPLIGHSAPISGVQGEPLPDDTVVATFVDTAPVADPATFAGNTDVTINWGDGSSNAVAPMFEGSSPAGTTFVVEDGHLYQNITDVFQAFQVTVTIVSSTEGSATVVTDLADMTVPVLTDPPVAVRAVAGNAFTVPVATIHTTNAQTTAGDFSSAIQWGDGQTSSAELVSEGGGTFEVLGSHTYASPGTYAIAFSLADNQGNTVSDTTSATVIAPPSPAVVPVASALAYTENRHLITDVLVTFDSPVSATAAADPSLFRLLKAGKKGSFTGRGVQVIRIKKAVYDAALDSVLLTVRTPFSLSKPVQLEVGGQPRSIVVSGLGSTPAATEIARPETVSVAIKSTVDGSDAGLAHSDRHQANHAAQVDLVLESNKRADLRPSIRARRR